MVAQSQQLYAMTQLNMLIGTEYTTQRQQISILLRRYSPESFLIHRLPTKFHLCWISSSDKLKCISQCLCFIYKNHTLICFIQQRVPWLYNCPFGCTIISRLVPKYYWSEYFAKPPDSRSPKHIRVRVKWLKYHVYERAIFSFYLSRN